MLLGALLAGQAFAIRNGSRRYTHWPYPLERAFPYSPWACQRMVLPAVIDFNAFQRRHLYAESHATASEPQPARRLA